MVSIPTISSSDLQRLPNLLKDLDGGSFVVIQHQDKRYLAFNDEDFDTPFAFKRPTGGEMVSVIPEAYMDSLRLLLTDRKLVTDIETDKALQGDTVEEKAPRRRKPRKGRRSRVN